jgi:uncharacterized Zn finger protein (UPF0148 family)
MNESLCDKCDMPMMEYDKAIACVFCKEEVVGEEAAVEETTVENEEYVDTAKSELGVDEDEEAATDRKELSRTEKLAASLQEINAQLNGKRESQLDQAEKEIREMIRHIEIYEKQVRLPSRTINSYHCDDTVQPTHTR